ncbi:MAG TPA: branched-chain amino acid ABC transporter permease [Actinomycetota bacterium]|nr:branched-chain amino acid ABC transporter permease [Actinomycetota bacterium]
MGTNPQDITLEATGGRVGLLQRFPVRRVIQWVLAVAIVLGVVVGTYQTLILPEAEGISGAGWRDLIIAGLARGSIYALIAIGYSLVYGILGMINFAHGEVFMAGAFSSYFVGVVLEQDGLMNDNPVLAVLILFLVAMAVSTGVAVLLERVAYRPLRNAPRLVPLITAIGASLFLQNAFRGFFGPNARGYAKPATLEGDWSIFGIPVGRVGLIIVLTALVAMFALSLFVARTKTGKSMRALSQDKEIASLMGINVDGTIVRTFAIGGVMAGIAGVLFAMFIGSVDPFMGFVPGIKAFTAAVLGGIGSIAGAALGGIFLGLVEAVAPFLLLTGAGVPSPNQLSDVVAFTVLVLVLIFRPGGILGTGEPEKV